MKNESFFKNKTVSSSVLKTLLYCISLSIALKHHMNTELKNKITLNYILKFIFTHQTLNAKLISQKYRIFIPVGCFCINPNKQINQTTPDHNYFGLLIFCCNNLC